MGQPCYIAMSPPDPGRTSEFDGNESELEAAGVSDANLAGVAYPAARHQR